MPGSTSSSAHKKRIRIQDVSDSEDSVCRNSSDSDDEVVHSAKKKSRRLQLSDDDEEEKENRHSNKDGEEKDGEPEKDDSHRKSSRINLMEGRKRRQSLVFEKLRRPKHERLEAVGKDYSDHDALNEINYNRIKTCEDDTDEDSQSGFMSDTKKIEEEEGDEEDEVRFPTKKVSLKHIRKPVIDDEDEEKDENGGAKVSDADGVKRLSSSSDSESDASDEANTTDIHKTTEMPWKTTLTTYEAFMLVLEMLLNAVFDPEILRPWNLENRNSIIPRAFQKISDEVHARKVIVHSRAWGRVYREALESHPCMTESDMSFSTTDCEACHRKDHPAWRDVLFTGEMYDEVTLQPNNKEDNPVGWLKFEVGRHCATRSSLYHCLYHYKYDLIEACRRKVKKMQEGFPDDESSDIIIKCMGDKSWIEDQFKFLESCLNAAEQYTEDAKYDSSYLDKIWRPSFRVGGLGFR